MPKGVLKMTRDKRLMPLVLLVTVVAAATGGIALAASGTHRAKTAETATPAAVRGAIAAFRAAPLSGANDRKTEASLKREFGAIASPIGEAEFDQAQSAPIAGSTHSAWIAPSGGDVCAYLPDPVNGWGGGCYSLASVESGSAYVELGGGVAGNLGDTVMVAVVVPDGFAAPRVVAPDGTARELPVAGNVAAAIVPSTDTLQTGKISVDLSAVHPTKVRWVG
jgi:hypothetical protein